METVLSRLLAAALLAAAEVLIAKLVRRWMTMAPAARPLGFISG